MVDYQYPSRPETNIDAGIIQDYLAANFTVQTPTGVTMSLSGVTVSFATALSTSDKAALNTLMAQTITPTPDELYVRAENAFAAVTWATISALDVANKKVTVKRVIGTTTHLRTCMISYSLQTAYLAGKLAVGDLVIVIFQPGDLTKALAIDKVIT